LGAGLGVKHQFPEDFGSKAFQECLLYNIYFDVYTLKKKHAEWQNSFRKYENRDFCNRLMIIIKASTI
jgi:hypothetical protein